MFFRSFVVQVNKPTGVIVSNANLNLFIDKVPRVELIRKGV